MGSICSCEQKQPVGSMRPVSQFLRAEKIERKESYESLTPENTIEFEVNLKNFDIKGNFPVFYFIIQFGSHPTIKSSSRSSRYMSTHKDDQFSFKYKTSRERIEKENFEITVFDQSNNNRLGNYCIDLKTIATGPTHYEFTLSEGDKQRMSFDIFMSQKVKISFQPLKVSIEFNSVPNSKYFIFSISCFVISSGS